MEHPAYSQLRPVTQHAGVVLCDNPSHTALAGTTTWTIDGEEEDADMVVVPGTVDQVHLKVVTVQPGAVVAPIVHTHRHEDKPAGALRLRQLTGEPIRDN